MAPQALTAAYGKEEALLWSHKQPTVQEKRCAWPCALVMLNLMGLKSTACMARWTKTCSMQH